MLLVLLLLVATAPVLPVAAVSCVSSPDRSVIACADPVETTATLTAGDPVTITVTTTPATAGLSLTQAIVNGEDVSGSFADGGGGVYTVAYTTAVGDEEWPWTGLVITLALDNGGSPFGALDAARLVPGAKFSLATSDWELPADAQADSVRCICVGDMNNDGYVDLFFGFSNAIDRFYWNDGDSTFTYDPSVQPGPSTDATHSCAWGDLNGDGLVDLYLSRHSNKANRFYLNAAGVSLTLQGVDKGLDDGGSGYGIAYGDVDGDGDQDIYLSQSAGSNRLFINDGAATFSEEASSRGVAGGSSVTTYQSVLADVNGDGHLDILVGNVAPTANNLYMNDGTGDFTDEGPAKGFSDTSVSNAISVADVNNDGALDVLVARGTADEHVYVNDPNNLGTFTESGSGFGLGTQVGNTRGLFLFDADNDGDMDFLEVVACCNPNRLWLSDSGGQFVESGVAFDVASATQGWDAIYADFDNDGDVDPFVSPGALLYENYNSKPSVASWFKVRPVTAAGAQSAYGATVTVTCTSGCVGWKTAQVVGGTSSYFSKPEYDLHLGVPNPDGVYNITVRWAADVVPAATPATHGGLGGLVPSAMNAAQRLLVVRQSPTRLYVAPSPWDYFAVNTRVGGSESDPTAGDTHDLQFITVPAASGFTITPGTTPTINGVDVSASFVDNMDGTYSLTHVTDGSNLLWPWTGLQVSFFLSDPVSLLASVVSETVRVGSTYKVKSGAGLGPDTSHRSACMGDVDGDSDIDVLVVRVSTANKLWINDGAGSFTDKASEWNIEGPGASNEAHSCSVLDVDGDGDLDVVVGMRGTTTHEIYINNGAGAMSQEGLARGMGSGQIRAVSVGDIDGDGDVDMYIGQFSSADALYVNDGNGVFADEAGDRGTDNPAFTTQPLMVDVDDNGSLDIVVVTCCSATMPYTLYLNDGTGHFEDKGAERGINYDGGGGIAGHYGDIDNDGDVDIVTVADALDAIFINDGNGYFTLFLQSRGMTDSSAGQGIHMVDHDLDGDSDVFIGENTGIFPNTAWINVAMGEYFVNGNLAFNLDDTATGWGVVVGDWDNDGDVEMWFTYTGFYYESSNAHPDVPSWLKVRPLMDSGAQSAFGATVRLECVAGCQSPHKNARVIDGGSGRFDQSQYDAYFGFPWLDATYNVSVRWPGNVYPPSNWTTHPGLGGIVPQDRPAAVQRTIIVSRFPVPLAVDSSSLLPWDLLAVTTRSGLGVSAPQAGDSYTLSLVSDPPTAGLSVTTGTTPTINNEDVALSFVDNADGSYSFTYVTPAGQESWPWTGLAVDISLADSAGLASTVVIPSLIVGSTMEEDAGGAGLGAVATAAARGMCVSDIDGDGAPELFIAVHQAANQLWTSPAGASYTNVASGWGVDASGAANGCAFGDVNQDGRPDLYVTTSEGDANTLYINSGTALTAATGSGTDTDAYSYGATFGDADGDGLVDLYVCTGQAPASATSHVNRFFVNAGDGTFGEDAVARAVANTGESVAVVAVDVTGDAFLDIILVNDLTANQIYVNDGAGSFTLDGAARGFTDPGAATGVAAADVTGDSHLDLVVTNSGGAPDLLYVNDGGGVFSASDLGLAADSTCVAVLDVESDGDLDLVVGVDGAAPTVFLNDASGSMAAMSAALGVTASGSPTSCVAIDAGGDLDMDVLMGGSGALFVNHNTRPGIDTTLAVRPLTRFAAASAFGAVVTVTCGSFSATRVIDGGAYDALVGTPSGSTCDVSVVFPGGATHSKSTNPALGGVTPAGDVIVVPNRPYVTGVAVAPSTGTLKVGDSVTVTLTAGVAAAGLEAATDNTTCCFVNDVQVRNSLAGVGDGTYTLTYTVGEGDASFAADSLTVLATLQFPGGGLAAVPLTLTVPASPACDASSPFVSLTAAPAAKSPLVWQPLGVACPSEASTGGCTFTYRVLPADGAVLPPGNMTSPTEATAVVGPFADTEVVEFEVWAEDAAGNVAPPTAIQWTVDLTAPTSGFASGPDAVSPSADATLSLSCNEADCTFEYSLNGAAWTSLSANATASGELLPAVDVVVAGGPSHATSAPSPEFTFAFNATHEYLFTNASVVVTVGDEEWVLDADNGTLAVPAVEDGTYQVSVGAIGQDGTPDVSPLSYVFTLDTVAPVATFRQFPGDGDTRTEVTVVVVSSELDCVFMVRSAVASSIASAPWVQHSVGVVTVAGVAGGVEHSVEAYVVDPAGNVGSVVAVSWLPGACPVAADLPDVAIEDSFMVGDTARYVEWVPSAPWAEYEYGVDGGAWVRTSGTSAGVTSLAPGVSHRFGVRAAVPAACDAALSGSRPPPTVAEWLEQPALPLTVNLTSAVPAFTPSVFADFSLSVSRRQGWLEYRLDGEAGWTPCGGSVRVGPLQPGPHTLEARGVDSDGANPGIVSSFSWDITSSVGSSVNLAGLPDGDHAVAVRATDVVGLVEVAPPVYAWRVDTVPPVTTATRTTPQYSASRTTVIDVECGGEEDPCLFCWTSESLVDGCSLNATLTLTADEDGDHTVDVAARDTAGWTDLTPTVIPWTADSTPPVSRIEDVDGVLQAAPPALSASADWLVPSTTLRLNLTADEPVKGFAVEVYGASFPVGSPLGTLSTGPIIEVDVLLEGVPATITAAGEDLSGNVDATPAMVRVLVDATPPTSTLEGLPASPTNRTGFDVSVSAVDDAATVNSGVASIRVWAVSITDSYEVVVAGDAGVASFTGLLSGEYNVTVAGVDAAGGVEPNGPWTVVVVDLDAPQSHIVAPPPAFVDMATVTATVGASEPGVSYGRLAEAGSAWVAALGADLTLPNVADGEHRLLIRTVDTAGNVEPPPYVNATFVVDTTLPVLSWGSAPEVYTQNVSVFGCFQASDASAVVFSVVGGPPGTALSAVSPGMGCVGAAVTADGSYAFEVHAVDEAGNAAVPLAHTWFLDRTPPATVVVAGVGDAVGCTAVNGVTVCDSPTAATVGVSCDSGPEGGSAPCEPQAAVETLAVAASDECAVELRRVLYINPRRQLSEFSPVPSGALLSPTAPDGLYSLTLQTVDSAGNVEAGNTTIQFYVDTRAPPAPTLLNTPDAVTPSLTAVFRLQLEGDTSPGQTQFWYSLDGGAPTNVTSLPAPPDNSGPVTVTVAAAGAGAHNIEFWARDQAGNEDLDGSTAFYTWLVATEAPQVVIGSRPANVSGDPTPSFSVRAVRDDGGVEPAAVIQVQPEAGGDWVDACTEVNATAGGWCQWGTTLPAPAVLTVSFRAVLGGVPGEATAVVWTYATCSFLEYALFGANRAISCVACPSGADCSGALTTQADLVALPGYWASQASDGLRYYECALSTSCVGGRRGRTSNGSTVAAATSVCATGYTGRMCVSCDDGYFDQLGVCSKCPSTDTGTTVLVTIVASCALLLVAVALFVIREYLPVSELKVAISMAQILATARTSVNVEWPGTFDSFLGGFSIFLGDFVSFSQAGCATKIGFFTKFLVTMVTFKVLLALVLVKWWVTWVRRRARHKTTMRKAVSVIKVARFFQREEGEVKATVAVVAEGGAAGEEKEEAVEAAEGKVVSLTVADEAGDELSLPGSPTAGTPSNKPRGWTGNSWRGVHSLSPTSSPKAAPSKRGLNYMSTSRLLDGNPAPAPAPKSVAVTPVAGKQAPAAAAPHTPHRVAVPWSAILHSCFMLLFLFYTGVSLIVVKVFDCVEVEDEWWLAADLEVPCYDATWTLWSVYAFIMGGLYTVGFPLSIAIILFRRRKELHTHATLVRWGFLYEAYGPQAYAWEVEELLRKLCLSALIILFPDGSPLQLAFAVLVCFWAHIAHGVWKPYTHSDHSKGLYHLQHQSLTALGFVYLSGMLLADGSVETGSAVATFLEVVMLTLTVGFLVLFSRVAVLAAKRRWKLKQDREPGSRRV